MINLLDNAIKHSPSRSEVAGTLSLNARLSTLNLSVTIHGPGIPPSEHVKTFERFYLLAGP